MHSAPRFTRFAHSSPRSCTDGAAATLEVRAGNAAAVALYRRLGFEEVGRRRRYYADGSDALLMTRPPGPLDAAG